LSHSAGPENIQLEGRVVYAVAADIAGYQYRIGVRFQPFEAKKGGNRPETRESLVAFENKYMGKNPAR
jgi:hypothetical protein